MKGVISRVVERVLVMFTSALVRGRASNGTCDLLVFKYCGSKYDICHRYSKRVMVPSTC